MAKTLVDLAIACGYVQHYQWWSEVLANLLSEVQNSEDVEIGKIHISGTALPDRTKNSFVGAWLEDERRASRTDANRDNILKVNAYGDDMPEGFMSSDAEWLFWMDDDTIPPLGVIGKLLRLRKEIVSGLYFMGGKPYSPLAYMRDSDGFYKRLNKYTSGMLIEVDSVGMGCCLIHKSVYQKILDAYELWQRPNGTLMPVMKGEKVDGLVRPDPEDNRPWPFYAMEYCRTEDHYFCELARSVGVRIHVDTTITCKHVKTHFITEKTYWEHLNEENKDS